jgi:CDP-paratose 2-epimerase
MKIVVTGGAGFIGCNAVAAWLHRGHSLVIADNLSRANADKNLEWLRSLGTFAFHRTDIRDAAAMQQLFHEHRDARAVVHLAGQVAVTTSVTDPRTDFDVNAAGTFNVLEAVRHHCPEAAFLFASTNKVYGSLAHARVEEIAGRYQLADRKHGVSEEEPLDFHSPYGCSKGAADQYVVDYARIYGLRAVSLRQSCIYGTRQFGIEDQGWVAWFTIAAVRGRNITIYGDGKQVRDVLFVDDLCELYDACIANIDAVKGNAFNVGGGPRNQLSLLELLDDLRRRTGRPLKISHETTRPGDQPVFVADIRKAQHKLGWVPATSIQRGLPRLFDWVSANPELFE